MHLLSPDINFCWFPGNFFRSDILEFLQFVAACKRSSAGVEIFYGTDAPGFYFSRRDRCIVFGCLLATEASFAMEFQLTILNMGDLN